MDENTDQKEESVPHMPGGSRKESGFGSMAAIVIILALLVLGGIYYLMTSWDKLQKQQDNATETTALNESGE